MSIARLREDEPWFGRRGFLKDLFGMLEAETNPKQIRFQPLSPFREKSAETVDIIKFV
ncbi:hypothetical protein QUA13_07595 [Microcoleus sp. S28C3]|uniref:hypothetical protein n=1 Tax=Microcoleus sp. S28C3 TaxID=3055414 RepID=UPI002FD11EF7